MINEKIRLKQEHMVSFKKNRNDLETAETTPFRTNIYLSSLWKQTIFETFWLVSGISEMFCYVI